MLNQNNSIVLGSEGFLGSFLFSSLESKGFRHVRRYSDQNSETVKSKEIIALDFQSEGDIKKLFKTVPIKTLFNCVALTDIEFCQDNQDEAIWINSEIPKLLAKHCQKNNVDLFHFSTEAVYEDSDSYHLENEITEPKSIYGQSKALGELYVTNECSNAKILRVNFVGLNPRGKGILNFFLDKLSKNKDVWGYADVVFNTVEVSELCRVFLRHHNSLVPGIYNFSGSEFMTKFEFGVLIAELMGFERDLVRPQYVSGSIWNQTRNCNQRLDTSKIEKLGIYFPPLRNQLASVLRSTNV